MPVSRPATTTPVGQTIRHHRKRRGWFQSDLANAIGTSAATVSRWERGREFVPFERREQIARFFDIDPVLLTEPNTVEVAAEERLFLDGFRSLSPDDRDALRDLVTLPQAAQEHAPC